ncbi:leucine-rich repeat domain-containing protein [Tautonia plasticadhaerens]|uniref:leucine-rich repeat domain-containing protein n=1 Tax=Tautonia plasticadhaerens TaxID=2527974 RepID=UPI0011A46273|nr:leucine-rich repeat domain-containing protein [Tautonia plasticadhaerens]
MKRRVSLRVMLAAVAVLAVGLAWWVNSARRQRAAVAAVQKGGGGVAYAHQFVNGDPRVPDPNGRPPIPDWLRTKLGDDFFSDVIVVGFTDRGPSQEALRQLRSFGGLRSLYIADPAFGDVEARHLHGLSQLEELYLGSTRIGDASIPVLEELGGLKELNIGGTRISNDGMVRLQRSLPGTRITHY